MMIERDDEVIHDCKAPDCPARTFAGFIAGAECVFDRKARRAAELRELPRTLVVGTLFVGVLFGFFWCAKSIPALNVPIGPTAFGRWMFWAIDAVTERAAWFIAGFAVCAFLGVQMWKKGAS